MAEMTGPIPPWENLKHLSEKPGEWQLYCSWGKAITYEGEWILPPHYEINSVTLSLAPWELGRDGKPRVNFYGAIRKFKITPGNVHKIPLLVKMVQDGRTCDLPFSLAKLKD